MIFEMPLDQFPSMGRVGNLAGTFSGGQRCDRFPERRKQSLNTASLGRLPFMPRQGDCGFMDMPSGRAGPLSASSIVRTPSVDDASKIVGGSSVGAPKRIGRFAGGVPPPFRRLYSCPDLLSGRRLGSTVTSSAQTTQPGTPNNGAACASSCSATNSPALGGARGGAGSIPRALQSRLKQLAESDCESFTSSIENLSFKQASLDGVLS